MNLSRYDLIILSHALLIGPIILVYALLGDKKSPSFLRNLVITIAILAIVYHAYNFIKRKIRQSQENKNKNHNHNKNH
jgi:hypothetical protein